MEAARGCQVKDYTGVIFRRTSPEIMGGGGIWDESTKLYPLLGGEPQEHRLVWKFPSGASIQFSHLQYEKDVFAHQGRQYCSIMWDEISHFTSKQFFYLLSRNRSTCGLRPWVRATTNPVPASDKTGGWVRRLIDWWIGDDGLPIKERSGVLRYFVRIDGDLHWGDSEDDLRKQFAHLPEDEIRPMSFTFIAAMLGDNKALISKDPGYRARLMSLPLVERSRLLGGNWNVEAAPGMYFRRSFFEMIDAAPVDVSQRVRAWDKAVTKPSPSNPDPDWTVGLKYSRLHDGSFCVEHVERFRESTLGVETAIARLAQADGKKTKIALWQDPGQAGKADALHFVKGLYAFMTHVERASENKVTYAGPVSSQAEAGNIKVVKGAWNDQFFAELEAFPSKGIHDDQMDALSLAHIVVGDTGGLELMRSLARWR